MPIWWHESPFFQTDTTYSKLFSDDDFAQYFLVIDSAGKLPDGVLAGRGPPMGNMKECKDIEVSNPRYDGEQLDSFVYVWICYALIISYDNRPTKIYFQGSILLYVS